MPKTRQINDPILHKIPFTVDFSDATHQKILENSLKHMRSNLYRFNGVGIAANQCAEIPNPPQLCIVGTNQPGDASKRYPNLEIPSEIVMINPQITAKSEAYFPKNGEGCLSVQGPLRTQITRYNTVTVKFYDLEGQPHEMTYQGMAAHIVLHECDHLRGLVYFQKLADELAPEQIEEFLQIIESTEINTSPEPIAPILSVARNEDGQPVLNPENLRLAIANTNPEAVEGLKQILKKS